MFIAAFYSGTTGAQVVDVFTLKNIEIGAGLFSMCFGLGLCILNPLAGKYRTVQYTNIFCKTGLGLAGNQSSLHLRDPFRF